MIPKTIRNLLTERTLEVLETILANPTLNTVEIANSMNAPHGNLYFHIKELERKELISREYVPLFK